MTGTPNDGLKKNRNSWWWPILVTLIGLGAYHLWSHSARGVPADSGDLAQKIHQYLGAYKPGTPPSSWKGLVGSIAEDNQFHREQYKQIACDIYKLQNKIPANEHPEPCPPEQGPPSTKPSGPPAYP